MNKIKMVVVTVISVVVGFIGGFAFCKHCILNMLEDERKKHVKKKEESGFYIIHTNSKNYPVLKPKEVRVDSKEEADKVIENINNIMNNYGVVSLADVYDMVGLSTTYLDNTFGWHSSDIPGFNFIISGLSYKLTFNDPIKLRR